MNSYFNLDSQKTSLFPNKKTRYFFSKQCLCTFEKNFSHVASDFIIRETSNIPNTECTCEKSVQKNWSFLDDVPIAMRGPSESNIPVSVWPKQFIFSFIVKCLEDFSSDYSFKRKDFIAVNDR